MKIKDIPWVKVTDTSYVAQTENYKLALTFFNTRWRVLVTYSNCPALYGFIQLVDKSAENLMSQIQEELDLYVKSFLE